MTLSDLGYEYILFSVATFWGNLLHGIRLLIHGGSCAQREIYSPQCVYLKKLKFRGQVYFSEQETIEDKDIRKISTEIKNRKVSITGEGISKAKKFFERLKMLL